MKRLILAFLVFVAARSGAQLVERPEPFDSAGRVMALTPSAAARLQLVPPAWRVTGDFRDARLFSLGDGGYVLVVTRQTGESERYSLTQADRDYLRARTALLPPRLDEQVGAGIQQAARSVNDATRDALGNMNGATRSTFVRTQAVLGVLVYGPSFAYAVTDETAGRIATGVLAAGVTLFGAAQIARDLPITPQENFFAAHAAVHGAAGGAALAYALGASKKGQGASAFLGGVGGTALVLWSGSRLSSSEVAASSFAADASAGVAAGLLGSIGAYGGDNAVAPRARAALLAGAGLAGYPLGLLYARQAAYNITPGDVTMLGVGALLFGAPAALAINRDRDTHFRGRALALTVGGVAGIVASDVLVARRYDFTQGDAGIAALGTAGGGLMGLGVARLVDPNGRHAAVAAALTTAGGVAGITLASTWITEHPDRGRVAARVRLAPIGLALAAARVPGTFSVLSVDF